MDGWTLVSWDGQPVPPASLPTELFVDVRELITAPQMAAYNIAEALLTGDPTMVVNAIRDGVSQVGTATVDFPLALIRDIVDAAPADMPNMVANLGTGLNLDTLLGGLSADLTNLLPSMATAAAGLLSGDLGAMVGEVLAAF